MEKSVDKLKIIKTKIRDIILIGSFRFHPIPVSHSSFTQCETGNFNNPVSSIFNMLINKLKKTYKKNFY